MEALNMKMVCEYPVGTLRNNITTVADIPTVARTVKNTIPKAGNPFLIFSAATWSTFPNPPAAVDFDMFPQYVASSDEATNVALIEAMLLDPPVAALTF